MSAEERVAALAELTAEELERRARKLLALARELRGESAQLTGRTVRLDRHVDQPVVEEPEVEEERPEPQRPREEEVVGRFGIVSARDCLVAAQVLGSFNRKQFAEKVGLKLTDVSSLLNRLTHEGAIEYRAGKYTCLVHPNPRDWIVAQKGPFSIEAFAEAVGVELGDAEREIEQWQGKRVIEQVNGDRTFRYVPPSPKEGPKEHHTKAPEWQIPPSNLERRATGMPVRISAQKKSSRRQRSVAGAGGIHGAKQRDQRYKEMQEKKAQRAEARKAKAQRGQGWENRSGKRSRAA